MKAVFRDTAVQISFEIGFGRGCPPLRVDGYSFGILSYEDGVVVLCVLIDKSVFYKPIDNLTVDQSFVYQVTVYSAHIRISFGQFERFLFLCLGWFFLSDCFRVDIVSKQTPDGVGIG